MPDLGPGICCRLEDSNPTFFCGEKRDFREISDPEMLYHGGVWYMYPSVRQAYVSTDLIHWEYRPLDIREDLGYAPTVVKLGNRFLLTASALFRDKTPKIYAGPTPLGPFENLGEPLDLKGNPLCGEYLDPTLFVDDDGRLYLYWEDTLDGLRLHGVELDAQNPLRAVCEPVRIPGMNPAHVWEHYGEYNEHGSHGWNEGMAIFKHNGEYYLQYAACGTNLRHYSLACYRSKVSPLGPFTEPKAPMAISPHGIVTGTGHGGWVAGPDGSVWQFYTCFLHRVHFFERRIGMDRVEFDSSGEPHVNITSAPQFLSGDSPGWVPVSVNKAVTVSSFEGTAYGNFAVDECTHTWWAPAPDDKTPFLQMDLVEDFEVSAVRILWAELNLDYKNGIVPEPVRFRIDFYDAEKKLLPGTVDRSGNTVDHAVEFVHFEPIQARFVRLTILCGDDKIHHGVTDFTVFAPPRK